jgi:hypothetical protein
VWACVSHRSGGRVSPESPRGARESTREVGVKGSGWGRFAWHDVDQTSGLEAVATADGASIAREIRLAVADRVEDRRKNPAFQTRNPIHNRTEPAVVCGTCVRRTTLSGWPVNLP